MNVITGLRRSGTSMLMYALKQAGLEVAGDEFKDGAREGNPNGYWEVDGVTEEAGLTQKIDGEVIKIMFEALPLSDKELIDKTVVIFRKPRKVLYSVLTYANVQVDLYIIKVMLDIIDTLEFLKNKLHIIVFYEDILENPEKEMKKICDFIGGDYEKAVKTIDRDLNRSKDYEGKTEHIYLWQEAYDWVKDGKIDKVLALKDRIEEEAKKLLEV